MNMWNAYLGVALLWGLYFWTDIMIVALVRRNIAARGCGYVLLFGAIVVVLSIGFGLLWLLTMPVWVGLKIRDYRKNVI